MKPCSYNRKLLVWLALGELDARREAELRSHLQTCAACSHYLQEISRANEMLIGAQHTPDNEASAAFHRRLVARLRTEPRESLWNVLAARLLAGSRSWRLALPLAGAAVMVIATLVLLSRSPGVPWSAASRTQAVVQPAPKSDLPPTIANYQLVANRSLDELDELLTRQGNRRLEPTESYTASTYAAAGAAN
jgi:anti-sigma factor RsiW